MLAVSISLPFGRRLCDGQFYNTFKDTSLAAKVYIIRYEMQFSRLQFSAACWNKHNSQASEATAIGGAICTRIKHCVVLLFRV